MRGIIPFIAPWNCACAAHPLFPLVQSCLATDPVTIFPLFLGLVVCEAPIFPTSGDGKKERVTVFTSPPADSTMRITTLLLGMLAAGCGLGAARAAAVPSDPDGDGLDKAQLEITAMDIALPVAFTALIGISNYAGWHFGRQYEKLQRERQNKINGNILETYEALPPDHRHLVDRRCKMIVGAPMLPIPIAPSCGLRAP